MTVTYSQLQHELERILITLSLSKEKAVLCSTLFANNSRDGFISHGLNRFPVFVDYIKNGMIDPKAEPESIHKAGALETWDGHLGLGMYNATLYGKLQEYQLKDEELPMPGGYDEQGRLTTDPKAIQKSKRALPIGSWKGAGLAMMLDVLVTSLSGGWPTAQISKNEKEIGVSQCFICIHPHDYHASLIEEILTFTKTSKLANGHSAISYPGERTLLRRKRSESEGITVNKNMWETILKM